MEDQEQSKGRLVINTLAVVGIVVSCAAAFVAFDIYTSKLVLSKSQYICTSIEQVGKNMDDVVCTQYTAQKYAPQAKAANAMLAGR
jgi:hypothetical protein